MRTNYKHLELLRDSTNNYKLFISSTGGGSGIQNILWQLPGISKILIGANFPYHQSQLDEFIGFKPEKYCCIETACHMAMASYTKSLAVSTKKDSPIGFGLTATLTTNIEHKGKLRAHIAIITKNNSLLLSCYINSNIHNRKTQGDLIDQIGINSIKKITINPNISLLPTPFRNSEDISVIAEDNKILFDAFMQYPAHLSNNTKQQNVDDIDDINTVYFAGSFNPPHFGHYEMEQEILNEKFYNDNIDTTKVIYSISIDHPYKSHLTVQDILYRSYLLKDKNRMFTTGESLFVDKIKNHPNRGFLLGADTLERLLDEKWGVKKDNIIKIFIDHKAKLFVCNRDNIDLNKIINNNNLQNIVTILNGNWNISSTQLRNNI